MPLDLRIATAAAAALAAVIYLHKRKRREHCTDLTRLGPNLMGVPYHLVNEVAYPAEDRLGSCKSCPTTRRTDPRGDRRPFNPAGRNPYPPLCDYAPAKDGWLTMLTDESGVPTGAPCVKVSALHGYQLPREKAPLCNFAPRNDGQFTEYHDEKTGKSHNACINHSGGQPWDITQDDRQEYRHKKEKFGDRGPLDYFDARENFTPNPHPMSPGRRLLGIPSRVTDEL
jgi:hypothetical protein